MKIRTEHGKGAHSGHEERYDKRADVKNMARKARRNNDRSEVEQSDRT